MMDRERTIEVAPSTMTTMEKTIRAIRATADSRRGDLVRPGDVRVYSLGELQDQEGTPFGTSAGQELGEYFRAMLELEAIRLRTKDLRAEFRDGAVSPEVVQETLKHWRSHGVPGLQLGDRTAHLAAFLGPFLLLAIRWYWTHTHQVGTARWPLLWAVEPELAMCLLEWEGGGEGLLPHQNVLGLPWRRVAKSELGADFRDRGVEPMGGRAALHLIQRPAE